MQLLCMTFTDFQDLSRAFYTMSNAVVRNVTYLFSLSPEISQLNTIPRHCNS